MLALRHLVFPFLLMRTVAIERRSCGQGDFHWDDPESSGFIDSECADLNLFNARIGDDGAKALALAILNTEAELQSINLRDNRISDDGAVSLAAALANNEHVRSLQLRGNDISDRGAIALAGALHTNTVLTDIYLTCKIL